jgi:hypothetical protein
LTSENAARILSVMDIYSRLHDASPDAAFAGCCRPSVPTCALPECRNEVLVDGHLCADCERVTCRKCFEAADTYGQPMPPVSDDYRDERLCQACGDDDAIAAWGRRVK